MKRRWLWTEKEDEILRDYVVKHGEGNWEEVAKKTVLESSAQHVHCHIQCKKTLRSFYSTTIYASNTYSERLLLWNTITKLSSGLQGYPWIVGGDFNEVRYSSEKVGGRAVHPRRLRKFNSCIEMSSLQDLKALGHTLSWNNRQVVRIMCRLDRVLVNSSFTNLFSHSLVNYLAPGISGHSPLKATYEPAFPSGPKPFKYFEMWESHPTFKDIVEAAWGIEVWGSPMYKIVKKLSATKLALKQWNKECFGPMQQALQQSRVVLAEIQALLQYNPLDPELISQESSARALYARQLLQEESFLKQKSRQMWLFLGDTNSKFFYDSLKSRSVVNTISRLHSIDGSELSSPEEIKDPLDSGASIPPIPAFGSITNEENLGLLSPVTTEEIRRALFAMKPLSSPGPDGFPARFFQLFWDISNTSSVMADYSGRSVIPSLP
ncbi:Trichome differentiation protein GL1 [Acorus calamus]|uniref:Trichome differentiation protein GL1 n=1 Tax=Acorus calamus TaxID=4465 RepID=A0AAV9C573_ACOCL|nr:Trichome differentiation protein GL1 [Acorus calamus]